jgi:hypothetical protein
LGVKAVLLARLGSEAGTPGKQLSDPTSPIPQAARWADLELTELQALCKERKLRLTGDETELRERLERNTLRS